MPQTTNPFNVEHQYQLFLERIKLSEAQMHPMQRIQLKQAFFGAWGQLLVCMRDDIADLPDETAFFAMDDMFIQVEQYWKAEVERYKATNQ
ncbi:hypothetical protein WBJ53_26235 [Spirosoma sp. SC4-14]|uniref:hypothetical protein n=1 Tax=Spirosoma sp. SC4-14 TaxID=3128900 RepID=UPI0030D0E179